MHVDCYTSSSCSDEALTVCSLSLSLSHVHPSPSSLLCQSNKPVLCLLSILNEAEAELIPAAITHDTLLFCTSVL